jgi:hypothetical protein
MPKNRNLTYSDQQSQVAREKKLAKVQPPPPVNPPQEVKQKDAKQVATATKKKSTKKPSASDL